MLFWVNMWGGTILGVGLIGTIITILRVVVVAVGVVVVISN